MSGSAGARPPHVLRHDRGGCAIFAGAGCAATALAELTPSFRGRTAFLLSTPRVAELHGAAVLDALRGSAARVVELRAPDGESAKSLDHAGRLWREMVSSGGKRDSVLVALGGGSLLDLGGFVAACFLRGIDFVHLPTTLLAQVDAAIGGKTGIDLPEAKNSVGAFRQPLAVVADAAWVRTLPERELRAGLQEVVKIAAMRDRELFERLERELDTLRVDRPGALAPIVERAIALKIEVVEEDPYERGVRRLLNFGHTLGHAIESELAYAGLLHGEAVAHGMLFALRLAGALGLAGVEKRRIAVLVERLAPPPLPPLEGEALVERMARDKKARETGWSWVLPDRIGRGVVRDDVPIALVRVELAGFLDGGTG